MEKLPIVHVNDILDWVYCPLLVWWKSEGIETEGQMSEPLVTSEQLIRKTIHTSIKAHYKAVEGGKDISFPVLVNYTWDRNLAKWGLEGLKPQLEEYATRKNALIDSNRKTREISVSEEGERLFTPGTKMQWRSTAVSNGLLDLRKSIDKHQRKTGLSLNPIPDEQLFDGPAGLADSYAACSMIAKSMAGNLPQAEKFIGAGVPVGVDLFSARLVTIADLVLRIGNERLKRDGRPSQNDPTQEIYQYELHLLDDEPPAHNSFAMDIRLLALRQSLPEGKGRGGAFVKGITVKMIQTGASQEFSSLQSAEVDFLDALVRAFLQGRRVGAYIPRMVGGRDSCINCEYQSFCFAKNAGIMKTVNPPLASQIQNNIDNVSSVEELINDVAASGDNTITGIMARLANWMTKRPENTPRDVGSILQYLSDRKNGVNS